MRLLILLLFACPLFGQTTDRELEFVDIYDLKSKELLLPDARITSQYWVVWNKKGVIIAIDTTLEKRSAYCYPALDCYSFESDKLEEVIATIKKISLIDIPIQIEPVPIIPIEPVPIMPIDIIRK